MARQFKIRYMRSRQRLIPPVFIILFTAFLALIVLLYLINLNSRFDVRSRAQINIVKLLLAPASGVVPPNQAVQLIIDAGEEKIVFVRAEVIFDRTKIQLAREIGTSEKLRTIIKKSTKDEANGSGRAVVIVGLTPADRDNPPKGTFELANYVFTPNTAAANQFASVSIDIPALQIINVDVSELISQTDNMSILINPTKPTPTGTQTPTRPAPTGKVLYPTVTPLSDSGFGGRAVPSGTDSIISGPSPSPESTSVRIEGDVTGDRCVNMADITGFLEAIFSFGRKTADINGDGVTNLGDLLFILINLGNGCGK